MSLRYLLDTNVISEPLRPKPNAQAMLRIKQHQNEIGIASIVWHELCFGYQRLPASVRRDTIAQYLHHVVASTLPILPYDERAAAWHAQERARLTALGRTPPFADGQVAAIAYVNQLILVTFNTDDYAAFDGITLEDWRV